MGLFEFFFPEQAQAEYLKDIASTQQDSLHQNWQTKQREVSERKNQDQRIQQLENDIGTIALILAAIMKRLNDSGQINRSELSDLLREMDLLDNVRDGKLSVEDLRTGVFLSNK